MTESTIVYEPEGFIVRYQDRAHYFTPVRQKMSVPLGFQAGPFAMYAYLVVVVFINI